MNRPRRRAMDLDLSLAADVQHHLLPKRVPVFPGYEFDAFYSPAGELGGDFYDFIVHGKGMLGITIGDAIGSGIAAALMVIEARALIRAFSMDHESPAMILRRANAVLHHDLQQGQNVCVFYLRLDLRKKLVVAASAGFPPLLVCKKGAGGVIMVEPEGPSLGAKDPMTFNPSIKEFSFHLEEGDRFLLCTGGATDALNEAGEKYGVDRMAESLVRTSDLPSSQCLHNLIGDVQTFRGSRPAADDVAMVTGRLVSEADVARLR